jgi:low affinity Fe/Cu permease
VLDLIIIGAIAIVYLLITGTTIITFLMVFVIQQSSNKDTLAIHIKLDEILRAIKDADDSLRNVEEKTEEELNVIKRKS